MVGLSQQEKYMQMNVNKKITRRPVKYAALSSGTISHVWYDEDQAAKLAQKRKNRIQLKSEKPAAKAKPHYDA